MYSLCLYILYSDQVFSGKDCSKTVWSRRNCHLPSTTSGERVLLEGMTCTYCGFTVIERMTSKDEKGETYGKTKLKDKEDRP